MKLLLVFACVVLAVIAGAAGALIVSTPAPAPQIVTMPAPPPMTTPATPENASSLHDSDLLARVDDLTREVTALRDELARMREGTARAPVTTALPDGASPRAEDDFAEVHREGILEVIEQDRAAREQQREADRAQREEEAILARAERAARELGLSAMQQKALADVYTLERQKLAELRATLVTDAYSEMPVNVREQFATLRQWRTDELTTRFGSDLAQKISELDADRWGRGRRGGGDAGTPR
jgi:hypothetical protein